MSSFKPEIRFDLRQRQEQKLMQIPGMRLSIEILAMQVMQLNARVEQELLENPVLELGAPEAEDLSSQELTEREAGTLEHLKEQRAELEQQGAEISRLEALDRGIQELESNLDSGRAAQENPIPDGDTPLSEAEEKRLENMREMIGEAFGERNPRGSLDEDEEGGKMSAMASAPAATGDLKTHLFAQAAYLKGEPETIQALRYLIENLDRDGYLRRWETDEAGKSVAVPISLEDLRKEFEQETGIELYPGEMEEVLQRLHRMDPAGVGARDFKECLLLQMRGDAPVESVARSIVDNHLEDLAKNKLPLIARMLEVSLEEVQAAAAFIRTRQPRPGARFSNTPVHRVIPDVMIRKVGGEWVVEINAPYSPKLYINPEYEDMRRRLKRSEDDAKYLKQHLDSARNLIDCIQRRQQTLLKVTAAIVERQKEFLENGPAFLKPLTRQDIADELHYNVSTVDRTTLDKWVQTPDGIFRMDIFFSGGKVTEDGEEISTSVVKEKISDIIDNEDKSNPLSDEEIVAVLWEKHQLKVPRRTVTKYRKFKKIPNSRQRKQF